MKVFDVSHVSSRGSSYRITLPKKVISELDICPDDIVTFIEKDGEVVLRKIKVEEYVRIIPSASEKFFRFHHKIKESTWPEFLQRKNIFVWRSSLN